MAAQRNRALGGLNGEPVGSKDIPLLCVCGTRQTETVPIDAKQSDVIEAALCLFCGLQGQMKRAS